MSQTKTDERRAHQRAGPVDGTWSGASGGSPVRIADVSEGGCFVESMAVLQVGERVMVKMALQKLGEVCVGGEVVAFHPGISSRTTQPHANIDADGRPRTLQSA